MERFFKPVTIKSTESTTASSSNVITVPPQKKIRVSDDFNPDDVVYDPGLRKSIEDYSVDVRDQVRRMYLSKGPCQPVGYNFPRKLQGKSSRNFKEAWFLKFDWLEYSVEKDAAYCFYCYLFKQSRDNNVFSKGGFSNWRKAIDAFNQHVGGVNSMHNKARRKFDDFKNQNQSEPHVLSSHTKEMEIAYGARLTTALRVVRFLCLEDLALCGNYEYSNSKTKGDVFDLFLNWIGHEVDGRVLSEIAPENNRLTSPRIGKELLRACAEETIDAIVEDLGDSHFSLLLDEFYDQSMEEQMAVMVRFVNKQGQVIERFLGLQHLTDTSAPSLKIALEKLFSSHGLCISRLRGLGYNGTSNIRKIFNDLKTLILNESPFAFLVHCFAQQLQLVVVSVAKSMLAVADFFSCTSSIVIIVGASCRRRDAVLQRHHDKIVEKVEKGEILSKAGKHQETNLTRLDDTRWGSHHTTLIRLYTMWDSVLEVLDNVRDDGTDLDQRGEARRLLDRMDCFKFVFIMHLMMKIVELTDELSLSLQQEDQNIFNAMTLIETVKDGLLDLRDNGWDAFMEEVKSFCTRKSIPIPNMEDSMPAWGRPRREGLWVTFYHHYHTEIFRDVLDLIAAEINIRFAETSTELLGCIACLDPRNSFSKFDHGMLLRLAEIYSYDFSLGDRLVLKDQLQVYIHDIRKISDFSSCHDLASRAVKMVENDKHLTFPLVYRLIELALILPVARAKVERAFSTTNFIKSKLHDKIGDEWLNDTVVCYIEHEIFTKIDDEKILQRFQNLQN